MAELSDAERRIVEVLKRADSATAQDLAAQFSTRTTAVRQHLDALEQAAYDDAVRDGAGGAEIRAAQDEGAKS